MAKNLCQLVHAFCFVALPFLASCVSASVMEGRPVNLDPNDPRPILSVQGADANEAALLVQQIGLDVVRMDGLTVYFFEAANQLPRLMELGYDVKRQNAYDVFRRVVRIDRSVPEAELVASGVRVINREKQFLIVDATIGQLRALVRSGSQVVGVIGNEPRPRQIRIVVDSTKDVARIGAMEVDIYSAKSARMGGDSPDKTFAKTEIVIYGGAFDFQIDQLRDASYKVEILPAPVPTTKGAPL